MKLMQEHGKPACNGLKMLLYQGVAAFEIWNGCKVSKEMAEKVYVAMREALGINE
jgi:shikimate dehydrogenase